MQERSAAGVAPLPAYQPALEHKGAYGHHVPPMQHHKSGNARTIPCAKLPQPQQRDPPAPGLGRPSRDALVLLCQLRQLLVARRQLLFGVRSDGVAALLQQPEVRGWRMKP